MSAPAFAPVFDVVEPLISTPGKPTLRLVQSCFLSHCGECSILGVDAAGRVALEEYYDDWLAQYVFDRNGTLLALSDEDEGHNTEPPSLFSQINFESPEVPAPITRGALVNHYGGRWRGMREEERVMDMAQPLSIAEKMTLTRLGLPGPILGLAESYTLAEAHLTERDWVLIRRLRVAFTVPLQIDEPEPYDYDTLEIYIAQWFDAAAAATDAATDAAPLNQGLLALGNRPMDAQVRDGFLFIADAGEAPRPGALHIFEIEPER